MEQPESEQSVVSAAILVIGDEILSGRTKDSNSGYIAEYLTNIGIDLEEVRVVPDVQERIVSALNELRRVYDYVFTTGGIGPTHDDITADSVATAFQVGIDYDPRAVAILQGHYSDDQLTKARMRMARIPEGADLVENPISKAPGFRVENVFVMAGVPTIMQAMMDQIGPLLNTGLKVHSRTIDSGLPEGAVAETIEDIQNQNDGITIGSYPYFDGSGHVTKIVLRGRDEELLNAAAARTENAITSLRARYSRSGT